jgi:hypothetical protein
MFTDGPEYENDSEYVRGYFCRIASGTLFLHELAICNLVGRGDFKNWVEEWISRNIPSGRNIGLVKRRNFFD